MSNRDAYVTTWQRMRNSPTANNFCTRGLSLEDREWLHDMPDYLADERDDGLETWAAPEAGLLDDIQEYDTELTLPRKPRQIGRGRALEDPVAQERQRKYYADLAAKRARQMEALRIAAQYEPSEAELRQLRTALADIEWDEASPALREAMRRAQLARGAPEVEPPPAVVVEGQRRQSQPQTRKLAPWEKEWAKGNPAFNRKAREKVKARELAERERRQTERELTDPIGELAKLEARLQGGHITPPMRWRLEGLRALASQAEAHKHEYARQQAARQAELDRQAGAREYARQQAQASFDRQHVPNDPVAIAHRASGWRLLLERQRRAEQEANAARLAVMPPRPQQVVMLANQILQIMRLAPRQYTVEDFIAKTGHDRAIVLEACERLVGAGYVRTR
jgi:hypothetical protein